MNLHGIVAGAVDAINPRMSIEIEVSTGYSTDANYSRTPSYAAAVTRLAQVQPMTFQDLQKIDALNIQGTKKAIYITGQVDGLVRDENKGGDRITLPDGTVWLVVLVLESWPDWCKAAIVLQE